MEMIMHKLTEVVDYNAMKEFLKVFSLNIIVE